MITTGVGKKFREELPLGIHTLSEGTPDVVKAALYGPLAEIGPDTDAYTSVGEIAAVGAYTAGGVAVPLTVVGAIGSDRNGGTQFDAFPYVQPTNDFTVTLSSAVGVRGIMLYNSSQSNRNIFTLDFGGVITPVSGVAIPWAVADVVAITDVLVPLLDRAL
jgi:hypothetical protein